MRANRGFYELTSESKSKSHKAGDGIDVQSARWTFSGSVANAFDEHVKKSVPLYESGHDLTVKLSDFFVKKDSTVYELGTSTGALLRKLAQRHSDQSGAKFIGLDVDPDMIDFSREKHSDMSNLFFQVANVKSFDFEKADLITSHYTVQFIPPKYRQTLFDNIFNALEWGGALIIFEKVRASDARFQDIFTTLYNEFKLENGYEPSEIISKSLSLKGRMEPFSSQANVDYMERAGFQDIISIQKYLCFEGWLAIK